MLHKHCSWNISIRSFWFKSKGLFGKLGMLLLGLGVLIPGRSWAYDGVTTFPVSFIEVNAEGNRFGFKLTNGTTNPPLCTADTSGWGIVQVGISGATQDGYKTMLATLMAAKLSGARVTVFAFNPGPGSTNCVVAGVDLL